MITIILAIILSNASSGVKTLLSLPSIASDVFAFFWIKVCIREKRFVKPSIHLLFPKDKSRSPEVSNYSSQDGSKEIEDYYDLLLATEDDPLKLLQAREADLDKTIEGMENEATNVAKLILQKIIYEIPNVQNLIKNDIKLGVAEIALIISIEVEEILDEKLVPTRWKERLRGAGHSILFFLNHLNHPFYGEAVSKVILGLKHGFISETASWLYDANLFEGNPDTDPDGLQAYARIQPYLREAGVLEDNDE